MKDQALGVDVVGDFLQGKTWADIKKWLSNRGQTSADLVMCRAILGFCTTFSGDNNEPLLSMLAEKALSITSPDGGMLLTDVPGHIRDQLESIDQWIDVKKSQNYQVEYKPQTDSSLGNVLKIKRKI